MNINDFVTGNQILSDVLLETNDESFKLKSRGWYLSQMQQALEELSFNTFFGRGHVVILKMDKDKLMVEMPKGVFNIEEIYLFKCDCGYSTCSSSSPECEPSPCCDTPMTAKVFWKRQFNNAPSGGSGYTASRKETGTTDLNPIMPVDGAYSHHGKSTHHSTSLLWANIQNGMLMFSSNCSGYDRIKIICTKMLCDIGDAPMIPRFFRQAVIDFVCERFYRIMKNKDPRKYRALWSDYKSEVTDYNPTSSWSVARRRAVTMDTFELETMREFWGRMNY